MFMGTVHEYLAGLEVERNSIQQTWDKFPNFAWILHKTHREELNTYWIALKTIQFVQCCKTDFASL